MAHKPLPDDWQVTFQEPSDYEGARIPGYTQVDKLEPGAPDSRESTNAQELEREGYEPFSTRGLKTGRYRVRDLRQRGLVGVKEAVDRLLEDA